MCACVYKRLLLGFIAVEFCTVAALERSQGWGPWRDLWPLSASQTGCTARGSPPFVSSILLYVCSLLDGVSRTVVLFRLAILSTRRASCCISRAGSAGQRRREFHFHLTSKQTDFGKRCGSLLQKAICVTSVCPERILLFFFFFLLFCFISEDRAFSSSVSQIFNNSIHSPRIQLCLLQDVDKHKLVTNHKRTKKK